MCTDVPKGFPYLFCSLSCSPLIPLAIDVRRTLAMTKLTLRYSASELERLIEAIYPEERRHEFTTKPWNGEGFRHYRDPKIACIEHYRPPNKPILPGALRSSHRVR